MELILLIQKNKNNDNNTAIVYFNKLWISFVLFCTCASGSERPAYAYGMESLSAT